MESNKNRRGQQIKVAAYQANIISYIRLICNHACLSFACTIGIAFKNENHVDGWYCSSLPIFKFLANFHEALRYLFLQ